MNMGDNNNERGQLPPGFRFYPTDEELIVHFLHRKASLLPCHPDVIPDLDLYPYDPWQLNGRALGEGSRWYFYSRKTENRITENGYWRPLGIDEQVVSSTTLNNSQLLGMKKHYIFHFEDSATAGSSAVRTNWIMHEYRLCDSAAAAAGSTSSSAAANTTTTTRSSKRRGRPKRDYSKWVLCRVYERDEENEDEDGTELSCLDEVFLSLDDLEEISLPNRIQ